MLLFVLLSALLNSYYHMHAVFARSIGKVPVPVQPRSQLWAGLRASAEVFPVPTFRDVQLHTAGAFEAAKIASLCHK